MRLVLEELGLQVRLVEERVWERREEFLMLNPAGTTRLLVKKRATGPRGRRHRQYLRRNPRGGDRSAGAAVAGRNCDRVEVRRLMSWFNDKLFARSKRSARDGTRLQTYIPTEKGGGPPDTETMRAARSNIKYHLGYIGWLVRRRDWLAGGGLTYADLSAAAHLSAIDYLGDVPWKEDETAKAWYARIKSRPSFRTLLAETLPGLAPAPSYVNLDF